MKSTLGCFCVGDLNDPPAFFSQFLDFQLDSCECALDAVPIVEVNVSCGLRIFGKRQFPTGRLRCRDAILPRVFVVS